MLWIDGSDTAVVSNNKYQGATTKTGTYLCTTPGWHAITIGYYQGVLGSGLLVQETPPLGTQQTLSNIVLMTAVGGSNQSYANLVDVTADSTIDVSISPNASLGGLTIGSNTLTLTGMSGANLNVGPTTISGSPVFSPSASTTLTLGTLNDSGTATTITASGGGTVALSAAATSLVAGTQVNITGGTLSVGAVGALGTAANVGVISGSGGLVKAGTGA